MLSVKKFDQAPCIWVYENAFDPKNFINLIEKEASKNWAYLEWMESKTGGHDAKINDYRTSLEMSMNALFSESVVEDLSEISDIFIKDIFTPIDKCVWDYRNSFGLGLEADSGYNLLKYENDAEYHIHEDHHPTNERVVSLVACIGEDFEGGELEFPVFNTMFKLNKGSLVIFPSNFPYAHIAHPVTSGSKYSLVTWFV